MFYKSTIQSFTNIVDAQRKKIKEMTEKKYKSYG